uniref:Phosphatidylinositol 4phosphate 5kinase (PIPKD3/GPCRPIPK) putative n=1 Tax=Albugo laibachii Nc14 TaxID=890382 RepID=F0W133_9STRA|nr:phosphatidylinositol 4phosphate 5kinase (PIPKD3/GPCRPIPK) putative [Albugo laibachii Nc14]|eukprot:CCA14757.1 phosphatidylinositol 4phosphate 5kinase (PIPKD3/GPCRPIPK) putative [Albugo laibachii Nc14]
MEQSVNGSSAFPFKSVALIAIPSSHPFVVQYNEDMHILYAHTGAFVSMISCAIIVLMYSRKKKWRRHPNPILYWKAVVDLVYAVRFELSWDSYIATSAQCRVLGILTQSLAVSSECWFLNMSLDLYQSCTNPFTNTKQNMVFYHWFAWTTGALVGLGLWLSDSEIHRNRQVENCAINETDTESLLVYYSIVIICVLSAVAFSVLEKRSHTFAGMREALHVKKDVIQIARISTFTYLVYQVVVISLWLAYVIAEHYRSVSTTIRTQSALSFLQTSRGVVDLIIWLSVTGVSSNSDRRSRKELTSAPLGLHQSEENNHSIRDDDDFSDVDIDLEPQLNVALRKEVLHFATRGIVAASSNASKMSSSRRVVHLRLHELGMTVRFADYHPLSFQDMRQGFGIKETLYRKSFLSTCHERIQSGGSSGAFMFYTADYSFIVKTVTKSERNVLLRMLPDYIQYMKENPMSHLTRFYGCHSIEMYRQTFSFVVMGNVIGKVSMHQFFDIKGSWVHRNAKPIPPGKTVICTYCSSPFKFGSNESCVYSIHGAHLPHVVLKDNDFHRKVRLMPDIATGVVRQLENDSRFLCSHGIMDYSLLLSTHSTKYVVDQASFDVSQLNSSPSKRKVTYGVCHRSNADSFVSIVTGDSTDSCYQASPVDSLKDEEEPEQENEQEMQTLQEIEYHNRLTFNRTCRVSLLASNEEPMHSTRNSSYAHPEEIPLLLNKASLRQYQTSHSITEELASCDRNQNCQWIGKRALEKPGYLACAVVGPDYYTFGIIDILQTWTWKKRLERWWKIQILQCDENGISAAPPRQYAERFQRKMQQIMMVSPCKMAPILDDVC